MVPRTRGSTTTLRPVMVAMVRATASISAPTKFRVTGSVGRVCAVAVGAPGRLSASAQASASALRRPARGGRANMMAILRLRFTRW